MSGDTGSHPPFDETERQAWIDDRLPPVDERIEAFNARVGLL